MFDSFLLCIQFIFSHGLAFVFRHFWRPLQHWCVSVQVQNGRSGYFSTPFFQLRVLRSYNIPKKSICKYCWGNWNSMPEIYLFLFADPTMAFKHFIAGLKSSSCWHWWTANCFKITVAPKRLGPNFSHSWMQHLVVKSLTSPKYLGSCSLMLTFIWRQACVKVPSKRIWYGGKYPKLVLKKLSTLFTFFCLLIFMLNLQWQKENAFLLIITMIDLTLTK